ncbi:MAG TPA: dienelactone hydrolase family protein [Candidatus Polarisedimenticolia bacterium]|jgi:carboxymethylenebutenolidase
MRLSRSRHGDGRLLAVAFALALVAPSGGEAPRAAEPESPPPSADTAKAALEKSARHGEWVDIKGVRAWVVYPERKEKAPVVLVVHEIFGLSEWIRSVADQLAKEGFIAVAPDLVSGHAPGGGGTEATAGRDEVVKLVSGLPSGEVIERLNAVRDHAMRLPASSGKTAVIGFCWGGATSFSYAAAQPDLRAAVVYYGTSPSAPEAFASIEAPVLGLYGGDDARVNATIDAADAQMKKLGKTYEHEIYPGAGHGFLRAQDGRDGANLRAATAAWSRTIAFLRRQLE